MKCLPLFSLVISLLSPAAFAGQGGYVEPPATKSQEEAGSVHVTVLGVARWDEVQRELQPVFKVDEKAAFDSAIPTTLKYYEEVISAWKAALKVGLPGTSISSTENTITTLADGKTNKTTTNTSTRTRTPGNVEDLKAAEGVDPSLTITNPSLTATNLGMDAFTRFQAAKTLFQQIAILNRSIKDAPNRGGYDPYLVNLQISLMPFKRAQAYDAYSSIAFFAEPVDKAKAQGIQYLIAYFKQNSQKIQSITNQPGVDSDKALTNLISNLRKAFNMMDIQDLKGLIETLNNSVISSKRNTQGIQNNISVVISKIESLIKELSPPATNAIVLPILATDTLEAEDDERLLENMRNINLALAGMIQGVGVQGGLDYMKDRLQAVKGRDLNALLTIGRLSENSIIVRLGAMLQASSHYAMVPRTHHVALLVLVPKGENGKQMALELVSRTTFRHATTGKELAPRKVKQSETMFKDALKNYGLNIKCLAKTDQDHVLSAIQSNDYPAYENAMNTIDKNQQLKDYHKVIWLELARLWLGSQYASTMVALPLKPNPLWPDNENTTALLLDDKKKMELVLDGGSDLSAVNNLRVLLHVKKSLPYLHFWASVVELQNNGNTLHCVFPSLAALEIAKPEEKDEASKYLELQLFHNKNELLKVYDKCFWQPTYKNEANDQSAGSKDGDKPKVHIDIKYLRGYLVAGNSTDNQVAFVISHDSKSTNYLQVTGPIVREIRQTETILDNPTNGIYRILKGGEVALTLGRLMANVPVKLSILDAQYAEVIHPISIPVLPK